VHGAPSFLPPWTTVVARDGTTVALTEAANDAFDQVIVAFATIDVNLVGMPTPFGFHALHVCPLTRAP
jgi:hypothetical protein